MQLSKRFTDLFAKYAFKWSFLYTNHSDIGVLGSNRSQFHTNEARANDNYIGLIAKALDCLLNVIVIMYCTQSEYIL